MFDKIISDMQEILKALNLASQQENNQDNQALSILINRLEKISKITNILKNIQDDLKQPPNEKIQEAMTNMLEALDAMKKELQGTENKPVKKTRSIHAEMHSSPNDRLTHAIFGQNEEVNPEDLFSPDLEPVRTDKIGKLFVLAQLNFENDSGVILPKCLADPYIRAVHDSVLSLYCAGNKHFTAETVFHEMTGNSRRSKHPDPEILKDIVKAVDILRISMLRINASKEAGAKGYNFKRVELSDNILHLHGLETVEMNGKQVNAYEFLAEPILYSYAHQKNQVLTYSTDMLALPQGMNMTRENVILQRYLLERIEGMKNFKNKLGNVILCQTIYEVLGRQEATRDDKKRIRQRVEALLNNWVDLAYIKGYKTEHKGRLVYAFIIEPYEKKKLPKGKE